MSKNDNENDLDILGTKKEEIAKLLEESSSLAEEIKRAHGEIFKTGLGLFDAIKESQEKITSSYNEIIGIKAELLGQTQEEDGVEEDVPGVVDGIKEMVNTLEARFDKAEREIGEVLDDGRKSFQGSLAELEKQIKNLLPGAMAAGLASGYEDARQSHKAQIGFWSKTFIFSMGAILTVAIFFFFADIGNVESHWEKMVTRLLFMVPFEVPGIWLAILSARKINQHSRLYEEYLHKWSVARTFEGMRAATNDIEPPEGEESLSGKLFEKALQSYSYNPSRALDGEAPSDSPADVLKKIVEPIEKIVEKLSGTKA